MTLDKDSSPMTCSPLAEDAILTSGNRCQVNWCALTGLNWSQTDQILSLITNRCSNNETAFLNVSTTIDDCNVLNGNFYGEYTCIFDWCGVHEDQGGVIFAPSGPQCPFGSILATVGLSTNSSDDCDELGCDFDPYGYCVLYLCKLSPGKDH